MNKDDHNDPYNYEADQLFNKNHAEKNHLFKKIRRRSIWRTILISIASFIVLSVALILLNAQLTNHKAHKEAYEVETIYELARPNTFITNMTFHDQLLSGELTYTTYKLIDGKPVYNGDFKESYSYLPFDSHYGSASTMLPVYQEGGDIHQYNSAFQRQMQFYHPEVEYEEVELGLEELKNELDMYSYEIGISFDQAYTLDELTSLLPDEIEPAWYWIDTHDEEMISNYAADDEFPAAVLRAENIYGMSAINRSGERADSPATLFIETLEFAKETSYLTKEYQRVFEQLAGDNSNIDPDTIPLIGMVVTGSIEELLTLEDEPYVRAVSLGASTK